jgi:hypothetical protein
MFVKDSEKIAVNPEKQCMNPENIVVNL